MNRNKSLLSDLDLDLLLTGESLPPANPSPNTDTDTDTSPRERLLRAQAELQENLRRHLHAQPPQPVQPTHAQPQPAYAQPTYHRIRYRGQNLTLREFADLIGVPYHCTRKRLLRGWTIERIANTPKHHHVRKNKCE